MGALTATDILVGTDIGGSIGERLAIGAAANRYIQVGQSVSNNLVVGWNYNATAGNAYGQVETFGGNNPLVLQAAGGNVLIGTTTPTTGNPKLDVVSNNTVAAVFSDDDADNAKKEARLGVRHYTNNQEPVGLIYGTADTASNTIMIGGGTSLFNTATIIQFYTAANTTTTTGTLAADITGVGASSLLYLRGKLQVVGLSTMAALDLSGQIDLNNNNIIAGGTAAFTTITASAGVIQGSATSAVIISGGTSTVLGANLVLYGETHSGSRDWDWEFRHNTTTVLDWDDDADELTVTGNLRITEAVGFFNTAPFGKQIIAGSRDGNAALASLLTALAGHGLITDNSS